MERATMSKFATLFSLLLGASLIFSTNLFGQGFTSGGMFGKVTDAKGSVIPEAKVTVTNLTNHASQTIITNADGFYSAPNLVAGPYRLTVEKQGFKTEVSNDLEVRTGRTSLMDIHMSLEAAGSELSEETFLELSPGVTGDGFSGGVRCGFHPSLYESPEAAGSKRPDESFLELSPGITGNTFSGGATGSPEAAGSKRPDESFLELSPGVTGNTFSGGASVGPDQSQDFCYLDVPGRGERLGARTALSKAESPSKKWWIDQWLVVGVD